MVRKFVIEYIKPILEGFDGVILEACTESGHNLSPLPPLSLLTSFFFCFITTKMLLKYQIQINKALHCEECDLKSILILNVIILYFIHEEYLYM